MNLYSLSARELSQLLDDIIKVSRTLHWSDKRVLRHINFREKAKYGCCFEFNRNIALHVGFSERTVRTAKKRLLNLNLIKKTIIRLGRFKKIAYILTQLGEVILNYLLKKFTISNIIKEISSIKYNKYLYGILKDILGTNGRANGKSDGTFGGRYRPKSKEEVDELRKRFLGIKTDDNNGENTQKIPINWENSFSNLENQEIKENNKEKETERINSDNNNLNTQETTTSLDKWQRIRLRLKEMMDSGIPLPPDVIEKYQLNEAT